MCMKQLFQILEATGLGGQNAQRQEDRQDQSDGEIGPLHKEHSVKFLTLGEQCLWMP